MISRNDLLARLQADRQQLINAIEGVPEEALAQPGAADTWSALDVLAYLTARDGETLRRIAFAAGEQTQPPHDVDDTAYWTTWYEKQVDTKRVLGPRGIKVDMAGTWAHLIVKIESLSSMDYARWIEIDPNFFQERVNLDYARRLEAWRAQWERSLPWWTRLHRKLIQFRALGHQKKGEK